MTKVVLEIANVDQMIKQMAEHWSVLDWTIGFVLNEPHKVLILKRPKDFKPYIYADLYYAKDERQQKKHSGRVSMQGGVIVGWGSKKQHTVSLSSCMDKYIAYERLVKSSLYVPVDGKSKASSAKCMMTILIKNCQVSQKANKVY